MFESKVSAIEVEDKIFNYSLGTVTNYLKNMAYEETLFNKETDSIMGGKAFIFLTKVKNDFNLYTVSGVAEIEEVWEAFRKDNDIFSIMINCLNHLTCSLDETSYVKLLEHVAHGFSRLEYDEEFSVDEDFYFATPSKETLEAAIKANPWLVVIYLTFFVNVRDIIDFK